MTDLHNHNTCKNGQGVEIRYLCGKFTNINHLRPWDEDLFYFYFYLFYIEKVAGILNITLAICLSSGYMPLIWLYASHQSHVTLKSIYFSWYLLCLGCIMLFVETNRILTEVTQGRCFQVLF